MIVLGIESSCDETAAAVVQDGKRLLSNIVASSMDIHAQYGGVVPEIAARSHIEAITPVIKQALADAQCTWDDIDAIAVTYGAGLGGSLLVGVLAARTLAITKNKPLYAINHVEAHLYVNFLTEDARPEISAGQPSVSVGHTQAAGAGPKSTAGRQPVLQRGNPLALPANQPEFPILGLIVSGGHSQLVLFRNHFDYTLLGQTHDDAIGEAFDKVGKLLGLPYPAGLSVEKLAAVGNPHAFKLPKAKLGPRTKLHSDKAQGSGEEQQAYQKVRPLSTATDNAAIRAVVGSGKYDFSFSGLKTAVLRVAQAQIGEDFTFPSTKLPERLSEAQKADIAASFTHVAMETLADKTKLAYEEFQPKSVIIGGGVASSPELRRQLSEALPLPIEYTDRKLCTDNGAMIATLGCFKHRFGAAQADPYSLDIAPNLSM